MTSEDIKITNEFLMQALAMFRSQQALGTQTLAQLNDAQIHWKPNIEANSIVTIVQHLNGNMLSRFTDFLTSDGEKPTRDRDGEFEDRPITLGEVQDLWEKGWLTVCDAMESLTAEDALKTVHIRGEAHTVLQAIIRQISHYGYHVGQMVYIGKAVTAENWKTLSIARRKS